MPNPFLRFRQRHRFLFAWAGRGLLVLYFGLGALVLAGRYWILPEIDRYRAKVETALTEAIGLPVRIGGIGADWPGLYPSLSIAGLQVFDASGQPALSFDRVEAEVDWSSLWHLELRLHRLEVVAPQLDIRRDRKGGLHVAGLQIQGEGDGSFAEWLLEQGRIVVSNAQIFWHDEQRGAPPLELQKLNFELRNDGWRHRFGLTAAPPHRVAQSLDLRGKLKFRDRKDPASWEGELYADLEQADLSAWAPWVDLPLKWSRGIGGVRLWLGIAGRQVTGVTADLRLAGVNLRLAPELPALNLLQLAGRLIASRTADGYAGEIRELSLTTAEGLDLPPTNARLVLRTLQGKEGGEFQINHLDFGVIAELAGYLPLPDEVHRRLDDFRPQGRVIDIDLAWQGILDDLKRWQVKGRFDGLALAAYHELPGFGGISGWFKGTEAKGEIVFDCKGAEIVLPAVFPEPRLKLASLAAEVGWQTHGKQVDLSLKRMSFSNHDATGEATGRYRYSGTDLGEIDLTAKLSNADGNAVWRYMPLVVNKDARDWLQAGIVGGRAESATLRLKGPLTEFPFRDGNRGIFQVKGSFHGASLKYAQSWPEITEIDGELLFEGVRMLIRAHRGSILGATLSQVEAEIADLEQHEEILTVSGKAKGSTQRFLNFVEASPVGDMIDHFTQPMTAEGNGELDLRLVLPLRRLDKSQVQGRFRLANNQLRVLPELPLLTEVKGEFAFGAQHLQAKGVRGRLLGTPLMVDVKTVAGGGVRVEGSGTLALQTLRRQPELLGWKVLDQMSGDASWQGSVFVKKPVADIVVESGLVGISANLPAPFEKASAQRTPLRVEGRIEPRSNRWKLSLGEVAAAQWQRNGEIWQGRIALGTNALRASAPLPSRGVALSMALPRLDLDAWRFLLRDDAPPGESEGLPLASIDARVSEAYLLGRTFRDVQVQAQRDDSRWRMLIDGREARGQLAWDDAGAGRISGRFAYLTLPAAEPTLGVSPVATDESPRQLPAIDVQVDQFRLHGMAMGEVKVKAENREGGWQARVEARNEAAHLIGDGRWRPSRISPETRLNFRLDVGDGEKLLERLGMPDALRRGTAHLEGDLFWSGSPFKLDMPSLTGQIKLEAEKGQFKKLEPGVGRLLGVLSLQALPRRISLDFRDVFSEGFAFDNIDGIARVERGIMKTDELRIRGPSAKVLLKGQANLVSETQDFRVRIQPAVGETLAVGAMIANPVAGAVAWAAQKVLNDPLDQAFAFEYAVTGSWAEPKVEKVSASTSDRKDAKP